METEVTEQWLESVAVLVSEVNPTDDPHKIAARGFTFGLLLAMSHPEYASALWKLMALPADGPDGSPSAVVHELVERFPLEVR